MSCVPRGVAVPGLCLAGLLLFVVACESQHWPLRLDHVKVSKCEDHSATYPVVTFTFPGRENLTFNIHNNTAPFCEYWYRATYWNVKLRIFESGNGTSYAEIVDTEASNAPAAPAEDPAGGKTQ